MKIKAYSFERNSYKTADIKSEVIKRLTDEAVFFDSFSDPNALFQQLSSALTQANAILLGVESQIYLKFKPVLIKAFGFTPAYSESIENAIGSAVTDEKLLKAHMLVPDESTELLSASGLYSGFYVCSNSQYIVVFPLDEEITVGIFDNLDLPFIKKQEKKEDILNDVASAGASVKARDIVNKLVKNGVKLAIPSTPASATIKDDIKACPNYENNVFFTPFVNDEGAGDAKEYAAELSKGAKQLRSTDLGASVSNIFREKNGQEVTGYFAYISVAAQDKVVVKKLIADKDESIDNLITEATAELYLMIDRYIDEVLFKRNATEEELKKYETSLIEAEYKADARPVASLGKKGTIIATVALAAVVLICIVLGFKFGGYFVNPSDEPESSEIQSNPNLTNLNPESTTFPGIPALTEEETTEPDEETGSTENGITEFESTTSIFDATVTATQPIINYTQNVINYTKPATTEKQTTTEKATKAPTTEKKTTAPSTTDGMMHGEMG